MNGYIILRDVPKEQAQLDLSIFEIKGGFRGFYLVPAGLHYAAIKDYDGEMKGFWCYLKANQAIIKVFDSETGSFIEDTPENTAHFAELALSGAMNHVLIPIMSLNAEMETLWLKLTNTITNNATELHQEIPMVPPIDGNSEAIEEWYHNEFKSRFEQAFYETHQGNENQFLAEFQVAFVRWILVNSDEVAKERWLNLIDAIYNAGERIIEKEARLFSKIADILIAQYECLPDSSFERGSVMVQRLTYLIEDMEDVSDVILNDKAKALSRYLISRGIEV